MSKEDQIDRLIRELAIKVSVGLLTKTEAETILQNFGRKIGYYKD